MKRITTTAAIITAIALLSMGGAGASGHEDYLLDGLIHLADALDDLGDAIAAVDLDEDPNAGIRAAAKAQKDLASAIISLANAERFE